MPRYSLNPDRLFDRPWRAGHPFRPKTGRVRRLGMIFLLLALSAIIFAYGYLTDSNRVRQMAEGYLSGLIGARGAVGGATLSVFEGLRLDDVKVFVDEDPLAPPAPDAEIFSARTFAVQYDYRAMLRGQLEATQIIAEKPHVRLTQDTATGEWNLHRLGRARRNRPKPPPGAAPARPPRLPEFLLRTPASS